MILAAGLTPAWQQILLFDQFQAGTAKWIPEDFVFHLSGEPRHAGGERWMRGGRHILLAIGKTWIGDQARG